MRPARTATQILPFTAIRPPANDVRWRAKVAAEQVEAAKWYRHCAMVLRAHGIEDGPELLEMAAEALEAYSPEAT